MKHTAPSRVNADVSDVPIAWLDGQDLEQSLPLQEYLEQNGVAVVVNRKPSLPETYHIICGDEDFVKETIASVAPHSAKPFIVLLLGNRKTIPEYLHRIQAKITAISGTSIPTRHIPTIFAYFFIGDEPVLSISADSSPAIELKPIDRNESLMKRREKSKNEETKKLSAIDSESLMQDEDRVSRVISDMFGEKKTNDGEVRRSGNTEKSERQTDDVHRSRPHKAMLLLLLVVIAPVVWYVLILTMIAVVQWYGVNALARGDVTRIETVVGVSTYWLGQGKGALTLIGTPLRAIGAGSIVRNQERVMSIVNDIVTAEKKTAELVAESAGVTPLLFDRPDKEREGGISLPVSVDRMRLALEGLTNALGLAGAQLRLMEAQQQFPFTTSTVRTIIGRTEAEIRSALTLADTLRNLLALYRLAGGFDAKKTYLITLQNSMELRPTGGFIGSVATVTVTDGKIETPVIQDVYALDGQLKGHVDPPGPIKELLDQEHWYLRDSNWDPDFRQSGARAAWFYEKETGFSVDGVIAVSTPLLTDLLGIIGPLDLPDYNDRITKENFFGKSLFYTKADFFPGSAQKKNFLGSLMVALMGKLTVGEPGRAWDLAQVISRALARGDIQFWFPERERQMITEQAGWAGEIVRPMPCETSPTPCMVNRMALVESNMAVNKVNAYVRRSIKSRIDLTDDGSVDGTLSVAYSNTSTDDAALSGGGTYLSYLRTYVPPDASVLSVSVDGEELSLTSPTTKQRTVPYRDPDEMTTEATAIGVAFVVPPGREKTIAITYRRGTLVPFTGNDATFVYSIRKQPGVTDTPLDAAIGYPSGWHHVADSPLDLAGVETTGFLANAREVRYNTTLEQSKTYTVRFRK